MAIAGAMEDASGVFPVVFFDGELEVDVGTIYITPSMSFKKLQAAICKRIGVSTHQISTSLVRRRKARASPDIRRKVPIDDSSDFADIARERDCFILAILRRSRRERRGRARRACIQEMMISSPERTILKRNPDLPIRLSDAEGLGFSLGLCGYANQMVNLQEQRAYHHRYAIAEKPRSVAIACEQCDAAAAAAEEKGVAPPAFHLCARDAVTVGFRTRAGPIQRPKKSSA
ncbi:hypothetical protein J5N97_022534 [Dioscorea zingiberensis]|uniref:DUF7138 domain-containing protein n=1 Tax=Dioscorea zingiberensis TaxID=325984 RepID=A0A9D5CBR7_9LILI|nr:hypothetical protein J5N97_022534 [Dioscorea zingiberensis]